MGHSSSKNVVSVAVMDRNTWENNTRQNIRNELTQRLVNSGRQRLSDNFSTNNWGDLESVARCLASSTFQYRYGYPYSSNYRPPDMKANLRAADGMFFINNHDDINRVISTFVDDTILSGLDLPMWVKQNARADLYSKTRDLTCGPYFDQWRDDLYLNRFDASSEDEPSLECQSVIVYANASSGEDGLYEGVHVFYFMGVYYEVESPVVQARLSMQESALDAAHKLVGTYVPYERELRRVLSQYAVGPFQDQFGYSYNNNPPDFPAGLTQSLLSKNEHLCYIQHHETGSIDEYVVNEMVGGFNIPINSVKYDMADAIARLCRSTLGCGSQGSWNYLFLDELFEADSAIIRPVRANGILLYFWDFRNVNSQQIDGTHFISTETTYIYFLGIAYELRADLAMRDLFREICQDLLGSTSDADDNNTEKWQADIHVAAKNKFRYHHGFDYDQEPPYNRPQGIFKCRSALLEFPHLPSAEDVKKKIDYSVFERNATGFSPHIGPQIYDNLVAAITYRAGPSVSKPNKHWCTDWDDPRYTFTGEDGCLHTVRQSSQYLFVYGEETEWHESAKKFYIHWLTSVCQIETNSDDDL